MFERLQKRSDGAYETPSGLFAIVMGVRSGVTADGIAWFEYKTAVMGPVSRVEWPSDTEIALLPQDVARYLVNAGYARGITDEQMTRYNAAVDADASSAPAAIANTGSPETPVVQAPWVQPLPENTGAQASPLPTATPSGVTVVPAESEDPAKEPENPAEPESDKTKKVVTPPPPPPPPAPAKKSGS